MGSIDLARKTPYPLPAFKWRPGSCRLLYQALEHVNPVQ